MVVVSEFERDLLEILYGILGPGSLAVATTNLLRRSPRPPCLGRACLELVQRALAQGVVWRLAREGHFQRRSLHEGSIVQGRLWNRVPPAELGLEFSPATIDFLITLTADEPQRVAQRRWEPLRVGDRWLMACAIDRLASASPAPRWIRNQAFSCNGLVCLLRPEWFAAMSVRPTPEFEPWLQPPGSFVLECLQRELAARWIALELGKSQITDCQEMARLGAAQRLVISRFLEAAAHAGRRDLAAFLLTALQRLGREEPGMWTGSLQVAGLRLAERGPAYEGALALMTFHRDLQQWTRDQAAVGFLDEGYAASQLWKLLWESQEANETMQRARRICDAYSW